MASMWVRSAPVSSSRLCGGMRVAIPTAIPSEPFSSRLGRQDGSTSGSCSESSKFGWKSTVSLSMSAIMCWVMRSSLLSV